MLRQLLTAIITICACMPAMHAEGIVFENMTLPEAQAKAEREGKLVFVDCYTPSCGPCKFMARNIFPLDSCGEYMNPRFVSVMKDLEADDNRYIAEKYGVRIYPTFLLLRPDGSLHQKIEGGAVKQAGKFIARVDNALKIADMDVRYRDGERAPGFLVVYTAAISRANPALMRTVLDDCISSLPADELVTADVNTLIGRIESTGCRAFRHVYDSRGAMASLIGRDRVAEMLIDIYNKEYQNQRYKASAVFAPRIAELGGLESEFGANVGFLKERMFFRDVINGNNPSGVKAMVEAIERIGGSDAAETSKVEALCDLRGLRRALGPDDSAGVGAALDKVLSTMSERSRMRVEGVL